MKTLKLSFALIIAVLAVGVTYASKAGSRLTTRCFTAITVTNGVSPSSLTVDINTCAAAETAIITQGKIYLTAASVANSIDGENLCPPSDQRFCCVDLVEGDPQDPNFQLSALLDLGDGSAKRYVVSDVFCKPQP
ncbi:hypothetical protein ACFOTA_21665 [Chitinophaga sp. GCM10012297]|uniref:Uncharacterized protein n=1 Tax=Chitinophaga chungangae TaxID=2821488 RepID=A0ABS3YJL0_9BACT|nr:hypothetical protein [Chitinophaga chungangae]MBO9154837.1 hypothetical protein [Chitinophaga chungangae]